MADVVTEDSWGALRVDVEAEESFVVSFAALIIPLGVVVRWSAVHIPPGQLGIDTVDDILRRFR